METIESIMTRRSVRKYDVDRELDAGTVETLMRAAMAAPSAGNQRPWRFVTVTDRVQLDLLSATSPYATPLGRARLGVVVLGDTTDARFPDHWVQDCSAATQNILLAAHALGLGAVWLGVFPDDDRVSAVAKVIDAPDSVTPFAMIAIGHPESPTGPADRYEPDWVHADRW